MPIIRADRSKVGFPHIYEIYFSLNGMKTISYIGRSSGENSGYLSGSSELNRVIANTVLCFGKEQAELGWHKIILSEFPCGTLESVLEDEEKRLILESYEESRRLGPGKNWEILNKEHLLRHWRSDAKTVLERLREYIERKELSDKSLVPPVLTTTRAPPCTMSCSALNERDDGTGDWIGNSPARTAELLEANFLQRAVIKIGRSVPVSISMMVHPCLMRTSIKMRVLFAVLIEVQRSQSNLSQHYAIRTSTLRYLLDEPNITSPGFRRIFDDLSCAIGNEEKVRVSELSLQKKVVQFLVECSPVHDTQSPMMVSIDFEKFMRIASRGQQAALGRRYFAVQAAFQYFQRTGQGLPFELAISLMSGKPIPQVGELEKRKELQSSCSKAIKSSETSLREALGTAFATNYFSKKKLKEMQDQFGGINSDYQVLIDNSETAFANFHVMLADSPVGRARDR